MMRPVPKHFAFLMALALSSEAFAHAGHDSAPGEDSGPAQAVVTLSDATIQNLGIESVAATLAPVGKTLEMNATVEYLPERYANITPKANGSIRSIAIKLGDTVKKGQKLLDFTPVFLGSSPVTLTSPISGSVVRQNVVIGQSVTPETVALEIVDTSKLLVKGTTYFPSDFEKVKVGQTARVMMPSGGKPLVGVVQRLDVGSSRESRAFAVYALMDNPDRTLFANTAAVLSVDLEATKQRLTVPSKAILGELGNYFLFVREGNRFERRDVVLGQKTMEQVEIIDGVLPDEQVVTVGNYQLQYAKPTPAAPAEGRH